MEGKKYKKRTYRRHQIGYFENKIYPVSFNKKVIKIQFIGDAA